ncbi:MAG: diguanylate cyclase [Actinobacteria bacterium]|nr:diguanylate cyclase [Actinomycetota bacterium]
MGSREAPDGDAVTSAIMSAANVDTGILLPQATLSQPWFLLIAVVVALNTIIYLGLTFAKLVPWPAQVHPRRVRALLHETISKDTVMRDIPRSARRSADHPYREMRMQAAQQTIPLAFGLTGGLVVAVTFINAIFSPGGSLLSRAVAAVIGIVMLVLGLTFGRQSAPAIVMVWAWTAIACLLVLKLCWDAVEASNPVALTYAVVAMIISPAISMSWGPSIVTGLINLMGITAAGLVLEAVDTPRWFLAATAALIAGFVLLQIRINSTDSLTLEQLKSNVLASTDPLTGLLTRNGLLTLAPSLSAAVERTGGKVGLSLVDINDLARANNDYGTAFGDSVIAAVGRAVTSIAQRGDLVSRWDGDCFLVLGIGEPENAPALKARIDEAIALTGVTLGKSPVTVSVGSTAGDPTTSTIDDLIRLSSAQLEAPQ